MVDDFSKYNLILLRVSHSPNTQNCLSRKMAFCLSSKKKENQIYEKYHSMLKWAKQKGGLVHVRGGTGGKERVLRGNGGGCRLRVSRRYEGRRDIASGDVCGQTGDGE